MGRAKTKEGDGRVSISMQILQGGDLPSSIIIFILNIIVFILIVITVNFENLIINMSSKLKSLCKSCKGAQSSLILPGSVIIFILNVMVFILIVVTVNFEKLIIKCNLMN